MERRYIPNGTMTAEQQKAVDVINDTCLSDDIRHRHLRLQRTGGRHVPGLRGGQDHRQSGWGIGEMYLLESSEE